MSKTRICKNQDNDYVNGRGAEEIPDFVPTRDELLQLLNYWVKEALDCILTACSSRMPGAELIVLENSWERRERKRRLKKPLLSLERTKIRGIGKSLCMILAKTGRLCKTNSSGRWTMEPGVDAVFGLGVEVLSQIGTAAERERERIESSLISVSEVLAYLDRDRYLNLAQAAEYLAMSTRTIRDRLDEIPHRRVGKKMLLFKKSELDTWLDQYREGGSVELGELVNATLAKVLGD